MINILIRDYDEFHLSNMLKHMDLTYNVIKRSLTDLIYVTPHDVIKREASFESIPQNIIERFYNKVSEHLEENDNIYFSGIPKNSEEDGERHFFSKRFRKSIIYKMFCGETNENSRNTESVMQSILFPSNLVQLSFDNKNGSYAITTLKQLLDSIQPKNEYIAFYSDFISAIRGAFTAVLDIELNVDKSSEISQAITKYINRYIFIDSEKTSESERAELINQLNNDIRSAIDAIRQILELE